MCRCCSPSAMNSCSAAISGRRWRSGWARSHSALAGSFGLYALAQACIVVTYWAVFTLGRAIVGTRHAVLGVLLMVGIAAFTVPSPDFGPAVLAAPLWALALLHYWRAVGEGQRGALVPARARSRPAAADELCRADPVRAADRVHARDRARTRARCSIPSRGSRRCCSPSSCSRIRLAGGRARSRHRRAQRQRRGCRQAVARRLALRRAGGDPSRPRLCWSRWPAAGRASASERAPEIDRNPVEPFARLFVYVFALAPRRVRDRHRVCQRPAGAARPRRAAGGAVRPGGGGRRRRPGAALSRAAWCRRPGSALLVAPPVLVVLGMRAAAVDAGGRSQDRAAGQCRRAASSPTISSAAPASRSRSSPAMRASRR